MSLFWLRPSRQLRPPIFSLRLKKQRRSIIIRYGVLFVFAFAVFVGLIVGPIIAADSIDLKCEICKKL